MTDDSYHQADSNSTNSYDHCIAANTVFQENPLPLHQESMHSVTPDFTIIRNGEYTSPAYTTAANNSVLSNDCTTTLTSIPRTNTTHLPQYFSSNVTTKPSKLITDLNFQSNTGRYDKLGASASTSTEVGCFDHSNAQEYNDNSYVKIPSNALHSSIAGASINCNSSYDLVATLQQPSNIIMNDVNLNLENMPRGNDDSFADPVVPDFSETINGVVLASSGKKVDAREDIVAPIDASVPGCGSIVYGKRQKRLTAKGLSYLRSNKQRVRRNNANAPPLPESEIVPEMSNATASKRCALSLETKVDVIHRVTSGEKPNDIADEYCINRHTLKSIMKQSRSIMHCWNKGQFIPGSQRIKGAKREDLENVLWFWYKRVTANESSNVTGSALCAKAMELAEKLGYKDFRGSHGWLDRFKKRRGIHFPRNTSKKCDAESKSEDVIASSADKLRESLLYHDPSNVFATIETGLFYRAVPSSFDCGLLDRCPGGARARRRFSILMCTNMTATEKFPLLVVGTMPKTKFKILVKESPVQYIHDPEAWLTKDCINAWLLDLDDWFYQHRRKVLMIAPNLPIHDGRNFPKLKAVSFYHLPENNASLQSTIVTAFKLYYRQNLLKEYINMRRGQLYPADALQNAEMKFPMDLCVQLLGKAWVAVTEAEIITGFQRAGINKYGNWPMINRDQFAEFLPELFDTFREYDGSLVDLTFDHYIHFDDNVQVCDELSVEDMIAQVLESDKDVEVDDVTSTVESEDVSTSLCVLQASVDTLAQSALTNAMVEFTEMLGSLRYIE